MTGLLMRAKRSTQPQGSAEIDRANPLTRNLVGLLVAGSFNSMRAIAGVNGNRGYGAEGHSKRITPGGVFQTALGGGYGDELIFATPSNFDEGYFGFALFYQRAGASGYVFEQNAPTNHNDGRIVLNSDSTLTITANGDFSFTSSPISDGLHTVVLANHRKAASQKVWLDGVLIASGTSTGNQGFTSNYFLTLVSSVAPLAVGLVGSALGNGVRAEQFAKAFSVNPWQLLVQRPVVIGFGAASSVPASGKFVSRRRFSHTRQPTSPGSIDWGHPLAQGLVSLYCGADGTLDWVNGTKLVIRGAPVSPPITTFQGKAYGVGDSSGSIDMQQKYVSANGTLFLLSSDVPNWDTTGATPCTQSQSDAGFIGLGFQSNVFWVDNNKALLPYTGQVGLLNLCGTWGSQGIKPYQNGVLGTPLAFTGASTAPTSATINFEIGCTNYSGGRYAFLHHRPSLMAVWNRALSSMEVRSLSNNPWQIFKAKNAVEWRSATLVSLPTLGRPASDTSTGQWSPSSGTTLSPMLNEVVVSDTDFIVVAALSSCEVLLTETSYPGTAEQTISYRASSATGNGLTVTLTQNGTPIASWSHALNSTVTLYTQTLTSAQIALIGAGPLSVILTST